MKADFNYLLRLASANAEIANAIDELWCVMSDMEWRPIETAPDDKQILICQDGELAVARRMIASKDGSVNWIIWRRLGSDAMAVVMPAPTHWMALPPPPEEPTR